MAKTTPAKSTTKKGKAKKKNVPSAKAPPPPATNKKKQPPPKPPKTDKRIEDLTEPLPSLPPLSKPIPYLEGKLTSDCKCYYFREQHPDTDWKDNQSIKELYKPFSHLGNRVLPACLLMDAANDQDRLILLNWWRFKTQEEQRAIIKDLSNTYAYPTRDNRLLPPDYWERIKQSQENHAARMAKEAAAAAAPPPSPAEKITPRPISCQGWRGEKYQQIFQYALEKYSQQPANVCNIDRSAEDLTNNLPLLFTQSKHATDLRFCIETVTVKEVNSSTTSAAAAAAAAAGVETTQTSGTSVANSATANPTADTTTTTTGSAAPFARNNNKVLNSTATAAARSDATGVTAATTGGTSANDSTNNPTGSAAPSSANDKSSSSNATTRTKQIYVLKSKHCEGVIHRTIYQKQYRCNACKKHNLLVRNLRELAQTHLQKNATKNNEKIAKVKAQLTAALKRETRLRARVQKYRNELKRLKKNEYRRKIAELKRKGLWPTSESAAAATSQSQRQPHDDDSSSSDSSDDDDDDDDHHHQRQQQHLDNHVLRQQQLQQQQIQPQHRFTVSPTQRQQQQQQHHLQMQQQTDRYWETQQQQHQQTQQNLHYSPRGLYH